MDRAVAVQAGVIQAGVTSTVLAHEHTLPVVPELSPLFADGALVKGRTLACTGLAATSTAMTLVAAAVQAGGWLAVIDVPTLGFDAAREAGVPLERMVSISTGPSTGWVDVMAAALDGFDVVMARTPDRLSNASQRKLASRIRQRGAIVIVLDDPVRMECDGVIESTDVVWSGLGDGFGHLRQRTVELCAFGRRLPGRRRCLLQVA